MVEVIDFGKKFPLPDALSDLDAREWALGLDPATNRRLVLHLIQWGQPLGLIPNAPQETHPLIERLEDFIGELIEANPAPNQILKGPHSPSERVDTLIRLANDANQKLRGSYSPSKRGAILRRLANDPVDVDALFREYVD